MAKELTEKEKTETKALKERYAIILTMAPQYKVTEERFIELYPTFKKEYKGFVVSHNGVTTEGLDPYKALELEELHGYNCRGVPEKSRKPSTKSSNSDRGSGASTNKTLGADTRHTTKGDSEGKT